MMNKLFSAAASQWKIFAAQYSHYKDRNAARRAKIYRILPLVISAIETLFLDFCPWMMNNVQLLHYRVKTRHKKCMVVEQSWYCWFRDAALLFNGLILAFRRQNTGFRCGENPSWAFNVKLQSWQPTAIEVSCPHNCTSHCALFLSTLSFFKFYRKKERHSVPACTVGAELVFVHIFCILSVSEGSEVTFKLCAATPMRLWRLSI